MLAISVSGRGGGRDLLESVDNGFNLLRWQGARQTGDPDRHGGQLRLGGDGHDDGRQVVSLTRQEIGTEKVGQLGGGLLHRALLAGQAVGLLERGQLRLMTC